LTGGAAFAFASSHGSTSTGLDDYPTLLSDCGEVQTSIVLGSDAAVTDVVQ